MFKIRNFRRQAQSPAAAALQAKFMQGVAVYQQGKIAEAERIYEEVLQGQPNHFDALHLLGVIAVQTKRTERGVELITKAIGLNAKVAAAHNNLGKALQDLKRSEEALASYDKAIALEPDYAAAYSNRGITLWELKRPEEALASYDKAIALKTDFADAYINRGNALRELKRLDKALASYDKAIALKPNYAEAYINRGIVLSDLHRPDQALASYDKAIALKPDHAEAYNNRGNALRELRRLEEALASYDKAIALKPDFADAYNNREHALRELNRSDETLANYDEAIAQKPNSAEAYNNQGIALWELKRPDEALASYDQAIALKPDFAEAYTNRGIALWELQRPDEALANYDKAIALKPAFAEVYNNRGIALRELKRSEEALASYDKAITLKPDYAEAYNNRGNTLRELKRLEEALASYDRAIALKPDYADGYTNCGIALRELKRFEEALASYDKAIALERDHAGAYNNRGLALRELKRPEDALASYDKAIALKPDFAEAYTNRGNALRDLDRPEEALASYDKAITLRPNLAELEGIRLLHKMRLCDWSNFDNECAHLISAVRKGNGNTAPFPLLAIPSSSNDQLNCARLWIANKYPTSAKPMWRGERYDHERMRVAYLSADFRQHPMASLMAGIFECHDKSRFDITAISFGLDDNSEMRQRLRATFEHFIDARTYSDDQIAHLVKESEIDILVDLMGFTKDSRTGIFALRSAPIQVNYLGYPGTMGAQYIDYILADRNVIPEDQRAFYAEKIVCLPNSYYPTSYQINDARLPITNRTFTRTELGLPPTGFVFCCFNNNYKITPHVFDCWMRILKQVEGGVLWLLEDNAKAVDNLRTEAAARGVAAERLIFAKRLPLAEHLTRHRLADLFLDTLPYNAHTTASDALWTGVPVLTCLGETFAGRVAASLLHAIDLPELVTTTPKAYEALAIELATNSEKLAGIKRKLTDNRLTTPLFDTQRFTKHIEAAYTAMYQRYLADLAPADVHVPNS